MYATKTLNILALALMCMLSGSLMSACDKKKDPQPENLIPESTYVDLLVDLQLLRSYSYTDPTLDTDSATSEIFKKYQVGREDFFSSHEYYQTQVRDQVERINTAIERIKKEQALKADGDSLSTFRDTLPF